MDRLLGRQLGVAVLGALLVLLIVVPLAMIIWQKMFAIGKQLMGLRDERTTLLNEVIQGWCIPNAPLFILFVIFS